MKELSQAVTILQQGGLVAFPTETVYGLGADASNLNAVRQVFKAKGRPEDHPLIVHLADSDQLKAWAREIPPMAEKLAEAYWPGPLTLVLKKQPHVLTLVTGSQDTVGIRIPSHPVALALLKAFGSGVVAPSANQFTHVSPTDANAVREELGEQVQMILDGGACAVGLESTIVDVTGESPVILRPGMITEEMIARVTGKTVITASYTTHTTRAPGRHHLHYAPRTQTMLLSSSEIVALMQTQTPGPIALMLHSDLSISSAAAQHIVKMPADAAAYAQTLYQTLRALDHEHLSMIAIEAVPTDPEWAAIRDRLSKATAKAKAKA